MITQFFESGGFIPHGHCYLWQTNLVGLHILSDGVIALAYYSIPIMLIYFVRQRQDTPFQKVFFLFGAFIIACGTTHIMEIWTLWFPTYWLSGGIKAITALISIYTASELVLLIPSALALPSPAQLIVANQALEKEINDRKRAEKERKQIEVALRNSEEQFRNAFENAPIGMAIVSLDGHWVKVNPALCQIVGYSSEELLGLTFQDITHPDDLDLDLSYVHQLLAGTISTYQLEKRYFHKQGHMVWILLDGSLVQNEHGNPRHFIAQIQEITARKEAQKTLEIQSVIMHNMAGGVCLVKASDLMIVYTNPTFDAMFGYTDGELAGQPVGVLNYIDTELTPDASVLDIVTQINQNGEAKYEVYNKKKDGRLFWCRVYTSMFEHPVYGTVYVSVLEDVTELKQAEQALQATTNRLNFLLNYSPVVIFSCKPYGDYGATFISENVKEVLGYESIAFLEDGEFWVHNLHPDDVERVLNGLANLFVNDFYFHEYRLRRSDGVYRWILGQLRLIRDEI